MTDLHTAALAVRQQESGIDSLRNALQAYEAAQGLSSEVHALEQIQIAARPAVLRQLLDCFDAARPDTSVTAHDVQWADGWEPSEVQEIIDELTASSSSAFLSGDYSNGEADRKFIHKAIVSARVLLDTLLKGDFIRGVGGHALAREAVPEGDAVASVIVTKGADVQAAGMVLSEATARVSPCQAHAFLDADDTEGGSHD